MLQSVKEFYWYLRGPYQQERAYRRLRKSFEKGQCTAEFSGDWDTMPYNRIDVVNRIIEGKGANTRYLEIGCAGNLCFDQIRATNKTGVDPASGGTHRMTSDAFFEQNDGTFDVVFVDGLHTFEQCRKDAMNALACVPVGGYVAFHDFLPRNWREEHVPRVQNIWTGDVWRVAVELMATKGVDFRLLNIDYGVGVARKISDEVQYCDKYEALSGATFADYAQYREGFPIYDFEESRDWLHQ